MEDNIEKKLHIHTPLITSYTQHAHLFSILPKNFDTLSWIFSRYLQLEHKRDLSNIALNFGVGYDIHRRCCPFILYNGLDGSLICKKYKSVTDFVIDCIDTDYYSTFCIDEFFVSAYDFYSKHHFEHNPLFWGYDKNKGVFYANDFYKNQKYSQDEIYFEELEKSINFEKLAYPNSMGIELYKLRQSPFWYKFDLNNIINNLSDYVNANNTYEKNTLSIYDCDSYQIHDSYYGINVYDGLIKNMKYIKNERTFIDYRDIYILYDHKIILLALVEFLYKNNFIKNPDYFYQNINKVKKMANSILLISLKCNAKYNLGVFDSIINNLKHLKSMEFQILKALINNITLVTPLKPDENSILNCDSLYLNYNKDWKSSFCIENQSIKSKTSNDVNSFIQAAFYGNSFEYYGKTDKNCGIADIFVDGEHYGSIDFYSLEKCNDKLLYSCNALENSYHVVRICNSNDKNKSSQGNYISFSRLNYSGITEEEKQTAYVKLIYIDRETRGKWIKKYGTSGYDIPGEATKLPITAKYEFAVIGSNDVWKFEEEKPDARLLEKPCDAGERVCALYYNKSIELNMIITSGTFALYLSRLNNNTPMIVSIYDNDTGALLDKQKLIHFKKGIYLVYEAKGNIKIKLTGNYKLNEQWNTVLLGIFWQKT